MAEPNAAVECRSIDALIPYARNSRTHTAEQVAQIAASIEDFGLVGAIVVREGVIAKGHGTLMAVRKLLCAGKRIYPAPGQRAGAEPFQDGTVPVIDASGWTDAQFRGFVIADNKLALNAGWDMALLSSELLELDTGAFDMGLLGFSEKELENIMAWAPDGVKGGLTDDDAAPEAPDTPAAMRGDVWRLGKHRLMCGDSASTADVSTLMDGGVADLVFTDPPYNVAYSGRGQNRLGTIKNDDMSDEKFDEFLRSVFACYEAAMKPLACIYVCHPDSASAPKLAFEKTFAERFKKSSTIIWVKQSAGMGWQDYRAQHEPIIYGWKPGAGSHFFCGDRSKTTVWQIGRDAQASYVHPTQKPVALPLEAVMNSSKGSDVVLDLFGGSGSTMIACEKSGRINRSMELDPRYCDVIILRWQAFTGQHAFLEADGRTFTEVMGERAPGKLVGNEQGRKDRKAAAKKG